uniref:Uncharacterized protein n=1 Tax=Cannabis sativa TaxID=3483 RepID=A0A803PK24_CANSA
MSPSWDFCTRLLSEPFEASFFGKCREGLFQMRSHGLKYKSCNPVLYGWEMAESFYPTPIAAELNSGRCSKGLPPRDLPEAAPRREMPTTTIWGLGTGRHLNPSCVKGLSPSSSSPVSGHGPSELLMEDPGSLYIRWEPAIFFSGPRPFATSTKKAGP